jgi:putative endonuclease
MPRLYYVYLLASASRVLYVGVTNDLERRVHQHKSKQIAGFTQKYNVTRLVHFESTPNVRLPLRGRKKSRPGDGRRKSR